MARQQASSSLFTAGRGGGGALAPSARAAAGVSVAVVTMVERGCRELARERSAAQCVVRREFTEHQMFCEQTCGGSDPAPTTGAMSVCRPRSRTNGWRCPSPVRRLVGSAVGCVAWHLAGGYVCTLAAGSGDWECE